MKTLHKIFGTETKDFQKRNRKDTLISNLTLMLLPIFQVQVCQYGNDYLYYLKQTGYSSDCQISLVIKI